MTRYLYIMGTDSGVGKSTVCLGILAQLLADGYLPQQLAYIKPMTQCVEQQAVARFCTEQAIECIDIGNLVFKKGYTRDFIAGLTPSSTELLATVLQSIVTLGVDKAVVLIDGIGSPAVGSVVGVANIDIAALLPCRIIFVGKAGIGAAIDDTVLNVSFIQRKHQHNVGLIYNKILVSELADTRHYVSKRIVQLLPNTTPLGFIASHNGLPASSTAIAAWFSRYVNVIDWFNAFSQTD
jgi:dethiobiotin synthetase